MSESFNDNLDLNIVNDDDELIRLVTSNADASSQYVIFRNGAEELFAINVAKVEELISYREINVSKSSNSFGLIQGVAKIRGNIVSIVTFDRWLGKHELDEEQYELVMMCSYGNQRVGLVIKNVVGIMNIDSKLLIDNSDKDDKTSYVTEITLGRIQGLCFVFDSDKMLHDVFPQIEHDQITKSQSIAIDRQILGKVLHAEDSSVVRNAIRVLYEQLQLDYEFFVNGQLLLDKLNLMNPDDISLIVTDLEMPVMDGLALMSHIKENQKFAEVPVVVNTNMANSSIATKAESLGARYIIHKLDLEELSQVVSKFAR